MDIFNQTNALIDLFGKEFIIPHYQRGYRWEEQEVEELLDDIWHFQKTSINGEFYCLQPIVLQKKYENIYHVLDGQQRLTTLYLILTFLEEARHDYGYTQEIFKIKYETRSDCQKFMEDKKFTAGIDESNIDYLHISNAYQIIKQWFSKSSSAGARAKLVPILMDENSKSNRNVRVIWYQTEESVNPIDIFIRLNIGKIPLTDAELIKALLLQSDRYDEKELKFVEMKLFELASEWDRIEYALQDADFWYFLNNNSNTKPTHIEFILDLTADLILREKQYFEKKPHKHATFLILSAYLQDILENGNIGRIEAVTKIWKMVTDYFEYFYNWYNDRVLFHYIGYLITLSSRPASMIDSLLLKSKQLSKSKFTAYLEELIGDRILISKKRKDSKGIEFMIGFEDLVYESADQKSNDRQEIMRILLLHNVDSSLRSDKEKARFPFNLYKHTQSNQKWSLEHIHAQRSAYITKDEGQRNWLADHIISFSNQNDFELLPIIEKMRDLLNLDIIDKNDFEAIVEEVYNLINKKADIDQNIIHSISNLCLVDSHTNSYLNNSVFDVKREKIKQREVTGHYIPVCTRNIFMKAYSEYPMSNAYWTEHDRQKYIDNMKKVYNYYTEKIVKEDAIYI
ncbi:DUF262 domain-containing protein [Flavobacterium sp. FlaQc-47]|uniref:DUF262 domain-containing protein n=1 Tax=Flavobacterium sp. FlaQc-47 TaxID=3374180 RepID=UPI003756EB59